jgi:hypothetical protein
MDSRTAESSNHKLPLEAQTMNTNDPKQGANSFPNLRVGDTLEEQIELNKPAMRLLENWIHEYNEPSVDSDEEFKRFSGNHR